MATRFTGVLQFIGTILFIGLTWFVIISIPDTLYRFICIILIAVIITFLYNMIIQFMECNTFNVVLALKGLYPVTITAFIGLLAANIAYCRIPVMSVFSPLLINTDKNASSYANSYANSNKCCNRQMTLEEIESKSPHALPISYAFYMFFAMLFGMNFAKGIVINCN
jgi:hypothetical protein